MLSPLCLECFTCKIYPTALSFANQGLNMGLKSSTLLQEEDIEELQNETGCKLIMNFDTLPAHPGGG